MRFANVFCSQCGRDFGPGDHGFSHCSSHAPAWVPQPAVRTAKQYRGIELVRDGRQWRTVGAVRIGGAGPALPHRAPNYKAMTKTIDRLLRDEEGRRT